MRVVWGEGAKVLLRRGLPIGNDGPRRLPLSLRFTPPDLFRSPLICMTAAASPSFDVNALWGKVGEMLITEADGSALRAHLADPENARELFGEFSRRTDASPYLLLPHQIFIEIWHLKGFRAVLPADLCQAANLGEDYFAGHLESMVEQGYYTKDGAGYVPQLRGLPAEEFYNLMRGALETFHSLAPDEPGGKEFYGKIRRGRVACEDAARVFGPFVGDPSRLPERLSRLELALLNLSLHLQIRILVEEIALSCIRSLPAARVVAIFNSIGFKEVTEDSIARARREIPEGDFLSLAVATDNFPIPLFGQQVPYRDFARTVNSLAVVLANTQRMFVPSDQNQLHQMRYVYDLFSPDQPLSAVHPLHFRGAAILAGSADFLPIFRSNTLKGAETFMIEEEGARMVVLATQNILQTLIDSIENQFRQERPGFLGLALRETLGKHFARAGRDDNQVVTRRAINQVLSPEFKAWTHAGGICLMQCFEKDKITAYSEKLFADPGVAMLMKLCDILQPEEIGSPQGVGYYKYVGKRLSEEPAAAVRPLLLEVVIFLNAILSERSYRQTVRIYLPLLLNCLRFEDGRWSIDQQRYRDLPAVINERMRGRHASLFQRMMFNLDNTPEANVPEELETAALVYLREVCGIHFANLDEATGYLLFRSGLLGSERFVNAFLAAYTRGGAQLVSGEALDFGCDLARGERAAAIAQLEREGWVERAGDLLTLARQKEREIVDGAVASVAERLTSLPADHGFLWETLPVSQEALPRPLSALFSEAVHTGVFTVQVDAEMLAQGRPLVFDFGGFSRNAYVLPVELLEKVPASGRLIMVVRGREFRVYAEQISPERELFSDSLRGLTEAQRKAVINGSIVRKPVLVHKGVAVRAYEQEDEAKATALLDGVEVAAPELFGEVFRSKKLVVKSGRRFEELKRETASAHRALMLSNETLFVNADELSANPLLFIFEAMPGNTAGEKIRRRVSFAGEIEESEDFGFWVELMAGHARPDDAAARKYLADSVRALTAVNAIVSSRELGRIARDSLRLRQVLMAVLRGDHPNYIYFSPVEGVGLETMREGHRGLGAGLVLASHVGVTARGGASLRRAPYRRERGEPLLMVVYNCGRAGAVGEQVEAFDLSGRAIKSDYLQSAAEIATLQGKYEVSLDLWGKSLAQVRELGGKIPPLLDLVKEKGRRDIERTYAAKGIRLSSLFLQVVLEELVQPLLGMSRENTAEILDEILTVAVLNMLDESHYTINDEQDVIAYFRTVVRIGFKACRMQIESGDVSRFGYWLENVAGQVKSISPRARSGERAAYQFVPLRHFNIDARDILALMDYFGVSPREDQRVEIVPDLPAPAPVAPVPPSPTAVESLAGAIGSAVSVFREDNTAVAGVQGGIENVLLRVAGHLEGAGDFPEARMAFRLLCQLLGRMQSPAEIWSAVERTMSGTTNEVLIFNVRLLRKDYLVQITTRVQPEIAGQACLRINIYPAGESATERNEIISFRVDYNDDDGRLRRGFPEVDVEIAALRGPLAERIFGASTYHFRGYLPDELRDLGHWADFVEAFRNKVLFPLTRFHRDRA